MKKLLISTVFLFAGFVSVAQQDAQFTQYMFNKLSMNPGSAGHNGMGRPGEPGYLPRKARG